MYRRIQSLALLLGSLAFICWAVLVNPRTMGWLFTSDGVIGSAKARLILWIASGGCLALAAVPAVLRRGRYRSWLSAAYGMVLLGTPGLLFLYWQANPNRHHWQRSLAPAEALSQMQVPAGFTVELVASEPDLVNPVAMAFDPQGRIWVTESIEYPRQEPGPGRDRIKILEDTTGDGRADRVTVFADGLNMPSGIAVGGGGVWVVNAPHLLFLQDTDGDDRADRREVVLTGFGRNDMHEVPNSLTWGPDGWLYGLNGISNPCRIEQEGREFRFSCAVYRVHPRTHRFEIFAQGTSNPWGIAWDHEGSAFISSCVIDHLWHITETGQYVSQSGHYPPHAWPIRSIVDHKHQAAAYCGLAYYDSDAYPPEYRNKLYMGNIHGGCLNVDVLQRRGASYSARPEPDFFTAGDGWFVPVSVKTGPDGSLYVLDWYDRYHCYQDAQRDPEGVDRGRGRLYRIRYQGTPRAGQVDLAGESNDRLLRRLQEGNGLWRKIARRLLSERLVRQRDPVLIRGLGALLLREDAARASRLAAWGALVAGNALPPSVHRSLLAAEDPVLQVWGIRATAALSGVTPELVQQTLELSRSPDPRVQLAVVIAASRLEHIDRLAVMLDVLAHSSDDRLLPMIAWENLRPLLQTGSEEFFSAIAGKGENISPNLALVHERAVQYVLSIGSADKQSVAALLSLLEKEGSRRNAAAAGLEMIHQRILSGEIEKKRRSEIGESLLPKLEQIAAGSRRDPLWTDAVFLAAALGADDRQHELAQIVQDPDRSLEERGSGLRTLLWLDGSRYLPLAESIFAGALREEDPPLLEKTVEALTALEEPAVAALLIDNYARCPAEVRSQITGVLTGRAAWAKLLLTAVEQDRVPRDAVDIGQLQKLMEIPDRQLRQQIEQTFGRVRMRADPDRRRVVEQMRTLVVQSRGDLERGEQVFKKSCSQCHKLFGQGHDVGPDLTANGRSNLDQLLSNVFDPNLVVGPAYQTRTILTTRGRVFNGLLVEESPQRVVLKLPGGKRETIPRDQIDEMQTSKKSLMPAGLEKQLKPQEVVDLFHYLLAQPTTDRL